MKITFVAPFPAMNGGNRVIAIYARLLSESGHTVTVISQPQPKPRNLKWLVKTLLGRNRGSPSRHPPHKLLDFLGPRHIRLKQAGPVPADLVPDGDAIFATWWETAFWVNDLPASKGTKFYLIQDYEIFPPQPSEKVIETYGFDLQKICVSSYIRDTISENHGCDPFPVVGNAVDHSQFNAPVRRKNSAPRIGLLYTMTARKRVNLALEAIEIAKRACPELELEIFGKTHPKEAMPVPDWANYTVAPPQSTIPDLYRKCDAWVMTSEHEGFGLPILEAMACRTPVVSTRAGAAPDLIDATNGRLVDGTAEDIADALIHFARMPDAEWQRYSQAAWEKAQEYTWPKANDRLLDIIQETLAAKTA